jgi:hypothetical protein
VEDHPPNPTAPIEHQNVPIAHESLHNFLYSAADEHGAGSPVVAADLESQGETLMALSDWCEQAAGTKIAGVYAVLNADQAVQYVNYSRNVLLSLQSHRTVAGPDRCTFLRLMTFKFPRRDEMEALRDRWIAEAPVPPPGHSAESNLWAETIGQAAQLAMTAADREAYEEKKLKLRKAMADQGLTAASGEDADRQQKLASEVVNDDWSKVIQAQ